MVCTLQNYFTASSSKTQHELILWVPSLRLQLQNCIHFMGPQEHGRMLERRRRLLDWGAGNLVNIQTWMRNLSHLLHRWHLLGRGGVDLWPNPQRSVFLWQVKAWDWCDYGCQGEIKENKRKNIYNNVICNHIWAASLHFTILPVHS